MKLFVCLSIIKFATDFCGGKLFLFELAFCGKKSYTEEIVI